MDHSGLHLADRKRIDRILLERSVGVAVLTKTKKEKGDSLIGRHHP
jgi:hypothetical protein